MPHVERSAMSSGPTPPLSEEPNWHVRLVEDRRASSEQALWGIPGISLAAQSFLFSTGFAATAAPATRILLGLIGLITAAGTALVIAGQGARLQIMRRWLVQQHPEMGSARQLRHQIHESIEPDDWRAGIRSTSPSNRTTRRAGIRSTSPSNRTTRRAGIRSTSPSNRTTRRAGIRSTSPSNRTTRRACWTRLPMRATESSSLRVWCGLPC